MDGFFDWFWQAFKAVFVALWDFITDIFVALVGSLFDLFAWIIAHIPVPDFFTSASLGTVFGSIHPGVLYFAQFFQLPACFALIAAGVGFRLLRKALTLGQW